MYFVRATSAVTGPMGMGLALRENKDTLFTRPLQPSPRAQRSFFTYVYEKHRAPVYYNMTYGICSLSMQPAEEIFNNAFQSDHINVCLSAYDDPDCYGI